MGGIGSGQYYRAMTKPIEAYYPRLNINALVKSNVFVNGRYQATRLKSYLDGCCISNTLCLSDKTSSTPFAHVAYKNSEGEKIQQRIDLTFTTPNYGGKRWWFICPNKHCGKRVSVLYFNGHYACRKCHNLAYASQNESESYRFLRKAQNISIQLGGNGVLDILPKPKHMHWETYEKKLEEMFHYERMSWITLYGGFYVPEDIQDLFTLDI